MFFITIFLMDGPKKKAPDTSGEGHDNRNYIDDEGKMSTLEMPRLPSRTSVGYDNSRL